MSSMKRKVTETQSSQKAKRQKEPEADYCDVDTRKDEDGSSIWPASEEALEKARSFLREWYWDIAGVWSISTDVHPVHHLKERL